MKISLITVAYNAADTLEDTLKSVEAQGYSELEYIVVDGGSTDGTLDILKRYTHLVDVLISEPDEGIYDAMNKGIALATGEVVGILNSDDTFADAQVISDVVAQLQPEEVDACYADLLYVDRNNPVKIIRHWRSGKYTRRSFRFGWMPPHPTFFLKKEAYETYGYFRKELKTSADYELMIRMLYKHGLRASYLQRVIVHMKTGGQSNTSVRNRLKSNREDRLAWLMNDLKPLPFTFMLKPLRKIGQWMAKT